MMQGRQEIGGVVRYRRGCMILTTDYTEVHTRGHKISLTDCALILLQTLLRTLSAISFIASFSRSSLTMEGHLLREAHISAVQPS